MKHQKVKGIIKAIALIAIFNIYPLYARILFSSITVSGYYRLADDLNNSITITVGNVTLDLNGHTVNNPTGSGIIINSGLDQITIIDGTVIGTSDGIQVNTGCSNITFENITAKNAIRGMYLDSVMNAVINNCEMTSNSTGLQLQNSHKINVTNCVASSNAHAGFDLISSTTNTFIDCRALSTGYGNSVQFSNQVTGFASLHGYGNIFERCIANSTQALSTTDSSSIIAGFALRGAESCSKIIGCEASNSMTSPNGYTVPYGILLEGTLGSTITLTAYPPSANPSNDIFAVDWSSDGAYLAIGGSGSTNQFLIYEYDRANMTLQEVAIPDQIVASNINAVAWSPAGKYIAIGSNSSSYIAIFAFDNTNNRLSFVTIPDSNPSGSVVKIAWSPDGNYLAVSSAGAFQLYAFDSIAQSLSLIISTGSASSGIAWSPDGNYLAVGYSSSPFFQLYRFNNAQETLSPLSTISSDNVITAKWSGDGHYIAAANQNSPEIAIYRFDQDIPSTSLVVSANDANVRTLSWSSDGNYLAVAKNLFTGIIKVYRFNRSLNSLILEATSNISAANATYEIAWSPDGSAIVRGGAFGTNQQLLIYQAIDFPSHNVIINNTVYDNSGGVYPTGVGISGSSICNLIIGNTAYCNPIRSGTNALMVSTNYYFACNIYNQLFGQAPTALQNISLGGCEPIGQQADLALLSKQILYKVDVVESMINNLEFSAADNCCSVIDLINSKLDVIESKIDNLSFSSTDNCCSTVEMINSKLDIIESKIDNLSFSSTDNCCSIVDMINSKLVILQEIVSINDALILSTLDVLESKIDDISFSVTDNCCSLVEVINSKIDELAGCGATVLTSADISGGLITISSSGNYCLSIDLTTDISITGTNVTLDLNGRALTGVITVSSNNVVVQNGQVTPAAPPSAPAAAITLSSSTNRVIVRNVAIACANTTVNTVDGRSGILISGTNSEIINNNITTGAGRRGGNGGAGIHISGSGTNTYISGCFIITGDGGSTILGNAGSGGTGIQIDNGITKTEIVNCIIYSTGNGGDVDAGTGSGGNGGTGISSNGDDVLIRSCTIRTGNGGMAGDTVPAAGGRGGIGIAIGSTGVKNNISTVSIVTGTGGSRAAAGSGGDGIAVTGATRTEILDSIIYGTGDGGVGTTGGNGGHGISITSSSIATAVRNCTIRNTGIAGTGGSSALPGKAIFDQSTGSGVSSIYANFANNIANGTKYDLLAMGLESGILLPNPPTATVINPYANVYSS